MQEPTHEIEAFFAGGCTPEQLAVLEAWINTDPANARAFMEQLHLRGMIGERFRARRNETGAVLAELARLEALAEVDTVDFDKERAQAQRHKPEEHVTRQDLAVLAGYVLSKAAVRKPVLIAAAAAAVLLVSGVVFMTLSGGPGNPTPRLVQQEQGPRVATLSGEHRARWAGGTPGVGDALRPGQTLELTAGLAEVTTGRGATAILQAPCTLKFGEDDNAVRLVSGKLFVTVPGSASGFTVDTPTARVVDVGTAFGVEVGGGHTTRLQVYRGEVRAAALDTDGEPGAFVSLYTEDAASIDHAGLKQAVFDPGRHERDLALVAHRPEALRGEMWWRGEVSQYKDQGRDKSGALQVFVERLGVVLREDTEVDLSTPGHALPGDGAPQAPVEAGKRVDVYLLHFDPEGGRAEDYMAEFVIRFEGRVLGVICDSRSLEAADGSLRSPNTRYPQPRGGKGGIGLDLDFGDWVRIQPDGRSLELKLVAATFYDQMLVLVEAED